MFKLIISLFIIFSFLYSSDLERIKKEGELKHLGVPYANFVTGMGDGLDVELIKGFAKHLGVKYVYVETTWNEIYGDLTGQNVVYKNDNVHYLEKTKIKGDLIANGLTILPWRSEVVNFSKATFPSGVWLISKANSNLNPITPARTLNEDIKNTKAKLDGISVLTRSNTCLDAKLYDLDKTGTNIKYHSEKKKIIEMVPAVISNSVDVTLLDVPDALIALDKWSGEIKVIGPISQDQLMGVAFRKNSDDLRNEFNKYFKKIQKDGTYNNLVKKYYPAVFDYYSEFFR